MKYISIDIETTGLDPERHQILEIAAVLDDLEGETRLEDAFHVLVRHPHVYGDTRALVMNADILKEINERGDHVRYPDQITGAFQGWLDRVEVDRRSKIVFAGKNFQGFDRRFLSKLSLWELFINTHHRSLDPTILYMYPSDKEPPSLAECVERAVKYGTLKARPQHRALDDALTVVDLIRHHYFSGQI